MSTISEGVARPVRGVAQTTVGGVIVECLDVFTSWEPSNQAYGLAIVVVSAVVSAIQNFGENKGWWAAFLRTVPPTRAQVIDHVEP